MKKVILSAGGTGGHVFSACALSLELRKNGFYTILITDKRGMKYISNEFNEVKLLSVSSLNWFFWLSAPWNFLKCLWWCLFKGDFTISFGGYVSFFPIISSIVLFKKFHVMQLDSVLTRLHRWFVRYACKVFYVFPQTNFFKIQENFYLTGLPVRSAFQFSLIQHSKDCFMIAVLGGSLGSHYWQELLLKFAQGLSITVRKSIVLYIQTDQDVSFLQEFEFQKVITKSFFDVATLLKKSHLVITRAGAGIIAEVATVGRPMFLVPWLNAVENHQMANAQNAVMLGGCATGDYCALLHFFSSLFESESCFVDACARVSAMFEIDARRQIVNLLLD